MSAWRRAIPRAERLLLAGSLNPAGDLGFGDLAGLGPLVVVISTYFDPPDFDDHGVTPTALTGMVDPEIWVGGQCHRHGWLVACRASARGRDDDAAQAVRLLGVPVSQTYSLIPISRRASRSYRG